MPDRFQLPTRFMADEQARRNFEAIETWINHKGGFDTQAGGIAGAVVTAATPGILAQVSVPSLPSPSVFISTNDPAIGASYVVPAPTGQSISSLFRAVQVNWAAVTDYPYRTYEIEYALGALGGGQPSVGWTAWTNSTQRDVESTFVTIQTGMVASTQEVWARVRAKTTNGKYSAWSYAGPCTMGSVVWTEVASVKAERIVVAGGAQMDSAVIGSLDLTKANVAGGSVLIDSTGIKVSGADFKIKDETNATVTTALRDRQNLLFDHSAELANVNQNATGLDGANGRVFPLVSDPGANSLGKWRPQVWTSGAYSASGGIFCNPSDVSAGREAAFDERALRLSPKETATWSQITPIDRAAPTGKYTFSAYLARHQESSGTINVTAVIQPLTSAYALNGAAFTSTMPIPAGSNFAYIRNAMTTPNLPASTAYLWVRLYTDASYCVADGLQLVSGNMPVPYQPESAVNRFLNGNNPSGPLLANSCRMVSDSIELRGTAGPNYYCTGTTTASTWYELAANFGGAVNAYWTKSTATPGSADSDAGNISPRDYLDLSGAWTTKYGGNYVPAGAIVNLSAGLRCVCTGGTVFGAQLRLYGTLSGGSYGCIHSWSSVNVPNGQCCSFSAQHPLVGDYTSLRAYLFLFTGTGSTQSIVYTGTPGSLGERFTYIAGTVLK